MDNHPAFTKDNREFLSRISDEVYDLSQDFQIGRASCRERV